MIQFTKSQNIPQTLQNAPIPTSANNVNKAIYGADDVRKQLVQDQAYKCAYCETPISLQYHDVEHYRPKSRYYWLAHNWDNLLYACELCNRSYKKNEFPLIDETKRDLVHQNISQEDPLIINPSRENPLTHIAFRRYMVIPRMVNGREDYKGKYNIELFHLNDQNDRPDLILARQEKYEEYIQVLEQVRMMTMLFHQILPSSPLYAQMNEALQNGQLMANKMKDTKAPYAGMVNGQI